MKYDKRCPLCEKYLTVDDDFIEFFCPTIITLPNTDKEVSHYIEQGFNDTVLMIVMPYRIQTQSSNKNLEYYSKIQLYQDPLDPNVGYSYQIGTRHWKYILSCPEIHPDTEENLLKRIKLLLVFS